MEQITYRKTLDVHKNGSQFMLQGFETADNLSRVIEISLMASGDTIDFPLEGILAMMYVTTPGENEPSINECTIRDNKVVYNVLPIVEEGITTMQLKLIETAFDGAKRVLASPKFSVEVTMSEMDDEPAEQTTTFTALENAMAKANAVYNARLLRIELDAECVFRAFYNDGTIYETDSIRQMILSTTTDMDLTELVKNGLVSFTADEVSEKVLNDISDDIDFKMGQAKYLPDLLVNFEKPTFVMWDSLTSHTPFSDNVSNSSEGFAFVFGDIKANHSIIAFVKGADKHTYFVHSIVSGEDKGWSDKIDLSSEVKGILPIGYGGTGAKTSKEAIISLGIDKYQKPWNVDGHIGAISPSGESTSVGGYDNGPAFGAEGKLEIYMKNSGNIYLRFKPYVSDRSGAYRVVYGELTIYQNDQVIKTFTYGEGDTDGSIDNVYYEQLGMCTVELSVTKGDIITVGAKCKQANSDYFGAFGAKHIHLLANVETPYIYMELTEGTDEITATDILNALTGGAE